MAKQVIDIGTTANDGTGDSPRTAFDKVNDNFTELFDGVYGEMRVEGGSTAQTGIGATPAKMTGWNTDGAENNCTVDSTTDNDITVDTGFGGVFLASLSMSFSGTLSVTFTAEIYKNAAATGIALVRKLGTGGDVGSAGCSGILALAAGDIVTVYLSGDGTSDSVTPVEAQLSIVRIAD